MADGDGPNLVSIGDGDRKAVRFWGQGQEDFRRVESELGCVVHSSTDGYFVGDSDARERFRRFGEKYDRKKSVKRGDWLVEGQFGDVHTFSPKEFESVFGDSVQEEEN